MQNIQSKIDARKIHRSAISAIDPVVGRDFIEYLMAVNSDGVFVNMIYDNCFNLTFQKFYESKNRDNCVKLAPRRKVMTKEAMIYAGFDNFDPYVDRVRIRGGIF